MAFNSSLKDFSLAELFRLIDQGHRSGCLTVYPSSEQAIANAPEGYHIWFREGRLIAAARQLDGQGLTNRIIERGWLTQRVLEKLSNHSMIGIPLGVTLKTQGVLRSDQLSLLFSAQIQEVCSLFSLPTGRFNLDGEAPLPRSEMTGLSIRAIEVALTGLRTLKNWSHLSEALPDQASAVHNLTPGQPQFRLNAMEWQVWEFAKGTMSLQAIAQQLNQPVAKVQQATFRLMLLGLVEECPLVSPKSALDASLVALDSVDSWTELPKASHVAEKPTKVSASFLQGLVGFLRSKP